MVLRGTGTTLDTYLTSLIKDGPEVVTNLYRAGYEKGCEEVAISTTLPSVVNIDVFIGTLQRWRNIQQTFGAPLRIWATCYNTSVEKYMLSLVQEQDKLFLTIIPGELKDA